MSQLSFFPTKKIDRGRLAKLDRMAREVARKEAEAAAKEEAAKKARIERWMLRKDVLILSAGPGVTGLLQHLVNCQLVRKFKRFTKSEADLRKHGGPNFTAGLETLEGSGLIEVEETEDGYSIAVDLRFLKATADSIRESRGIRRQYPAEAVA